MSTLSTFRRPVKSTRLKPRPASHRFGIGLVRAIPSHKAPASAADVQWWAVECYVSTPEDRHFDAMAEEAGHQDQLDRGICL